MKGYKYGIADEDSNYITYDVPINVSDDNVGKKIIPTQDSPDEGTNEYPKFSTASISIGQW